MMNKDMNLSKTILLFFLFMVVLTTSVQAQFEEPKFRKIEVTERDQYRDFFEGFKLTGQGLYNQTELDRMPAIEIRARLQDVFGGPTQTVEELIAENDFRLGKAIQFEYWFIVDDKIPMMVLDLDGPFTDGLVYVGASRYIDLMPEIKRTLTRLIEDANPGEYQDYFYSPEREQWFKISYANGEYKNEKIDAPSHLKIN
jgi:hypothetical protein